MSGRYLMKHRHFLAKSSEPQGGQSTYGLSLEQQLRDPYFYLADYDFADEAMIFAFANPSDLVKSLRITAQDFPIQRLISIPIERIFERATWRLPEPSINYLFHTPFCGSTLLTRYLETSSMVQRDPVSVSALYLAGAQGFPKFIPRLRKTALKLLNRRPTDRPVIVRTAGYHPQIMKPLVGSSTFRSAIFLYMSPDQYLGQVLKSPRRRWQIKTLMLEQSAYVRRRVQQELATLLDPEVAMLFWVRTVETILNLAQRCRGLGIRALESDALVADPTHALSQVCRRFGVADLTLERAQIAEIESRHAKTGRSFDADARRTELQESLAAYSSEIELGMDFLGRVDPRGGLMSNLRGLALP